MATSVMQKFIGTKRTVSAGFSGKSKISSTVKRRYPFYVMCLESRGQGLSLVACRVYQVIKPHRLDHPTDYRVIDEEGEDYLYPAKLFVPVELPPKAKRVVAAGYVAASAS